MKKRERDRCQKRWDDPKPSCTSSSPTFFLTRQTKRVKNLQPHALPRPSLHISTFPSSPFFAVGRTRNSVEILKSHSCRHFTQEVLGGQIFCRNCHVYIFLRATECVAASRCLKTISDIFRAVMESCCTCVYESASMCLSLSLSLHESVCEPAPSFSPTRCLCPSGAPPASNPPSPRSRFSASWISVTILHIIWYWSIRVCV